MIRHCTAALLTMAIGWTAHADIYRRVDEKGVVRFSNVPDGEGWEIFLEEDRPLRQDTSNTQKRRQIFARHVREAAALYALPEGLIKAVIDVESGWNPTAVSRAGAQGLMQLMPRTARSMGARDAFDPRQNILAGTRYLRILANKFAGDLVLTLAAYNAGEGNVIREMAPPFPATRGYVQSVLNRFRAYTPQ